MLPGKNRGAPFGDSGLNGMIRWFHRRIFGQVSLREFEPRVDELIRDPSAFLGEGSLVIPSIRIWPVALFMIIVGPVVGAEMGGPGIVGLVIFLIVEAAAVVLMVVPRPQLDFTGNGVRFRRGNHSIHIPYILFSTDGVPVIQSFGGGHSGMTLPLRREDLDDIVQETKGRPKVRGARARIAGCKIKASGEMEISGDYRVSLDELSGLLQALGRTAEEKTTSSRSPQERETGDRVEWKGNRVRVSTVRLRFPPACCICGLKTDRGWEFVGGPPGSVFLVIFGFSMALRLTVPCCDSCGESIRVRDRRARWIGALLGAGIGMTLFGIFGAILRYFSVVDHLILPFMGAGFLAGGLLGLLLGVASVVGVGIRSSWFSGEVRLQFEQEGYAEKVAAASRGEAKTS
jgi:hypothetical protein